MALSVDRMPKNPVQWGLEVQQLLAFAIDTVFKGKGDENMECGDVSAIGKKFAQIFLLELYHDDASNKLNMYKLNTEIIQPLTKGHGVGLANFLNKDSPKSATVFVSHAWIERFALLVFSLCLGCWPISRPGDQKARDKYYATKLGIDVKNLLQPNAVLWICTLSINQNQDIGGALAGDVMESPFAIVLGQCVECRVVYNATFNLYSRVWCCLEMYLADEKAQKDKSFRIHTVGIPPNQLVENAMTWAEATMGDELEMIKESSCEATPFESNDSCFVGCMYAFVIKFVLRFCPKLYRPVDFFVYRRLKVPYPTGPPEPTLNPEKYAEKIQAQVMPKYFADPGRSVDVRNAKASVEQDRVDILRRIESRVDDVNKVVNGSLAQVLAKNMAVRLRGM